MSAMNVLAHTDWWDAGFADLGWFAIKAILVWLTLAVVWVPLMMALAVFVEWVKR